MVRTILGIIAGFITWIILWVGGGEVMAALSPDWYGGHRIAFEKAAMNGTTFHADPVILIVFLVRSVITSLMAGYLAVVISRESSRTPLIAGAMLVVVAIFLEAMAGPLLPLWYHIIFPLLIIPVMIAGGRLAKKH